MMISAVKDLEKKRITIGIATFILLGLLTYFVKKYPAIEKNTHPNLSFYLAVLTFHLGLYAYFKILGVVFGYVINSRIARRISSTTIDSAKKMIIYTIAIVDIFSAAMIWLDAWIELYYLHFRKEIKFLEPFINWLRGYLATFILQLGSYCYFKICCFIIPWIFDVVVLAVSGRNHRKQIQRMKNKAKDVIPSDGKLTVSEDEVISITKMIIGIAAFLLLDLIVLSIDVERQFKDYPLMRREIKEELLEPPIIVLYHCLAVLIPHLELFYYSKSWRLVFYWVIGAVNFPFRISDYRDKQSQNIKDLMSDVKILKFKIDQQNEFFLKEISRLQRLVIKRTKFEDEF